MALALPIKTIDEFSSIKDPEEFKRIALEKINVDQVDVFLNRVLTIVYIGYERTAGGIIKPHDTKAEDIYQGKVALVLKVGPTAFVSDATHDFHGMFVARGNWVTFRIGNSSQIEISKVPCRLVSDHYIELRVSDPRMVTS